MMKLTIGIVALLLSSSALAQAGPVGGTGRYVIVHSPHKQSDTVLLDTATGKTWQLQSDAARDAVIWVPMARSDNPVEMQQWQQENPRVSSPKPPASN